MRLLAFDDATEARELCEHHGLSVSSDGHIHMGKTGFIDPETAFPPHRSARLVDGKQSASLGEVYFNCLLHSNHCSPLSLC